MRIYSILMISFESLFQAFDKEIEDQMHKFDMKAVMDLDQVVS